MIVDKRDRRADILRKYRERFAASIRHSLIGSLAQAGAYACMLPILYELSRPPVDTGTQPRGIRQVPTWSSARAASPSSSESSSPGGSSSRPRMRAGRPLPGRG